MEIIFLKDFKDIVTNIDGLGLVLGYFDGVHIGHSQLISFAKASTKKGSLGVLTFDRPLKSVEGSLMSIDDKLQALEKLDVDYAFVVICDDNLKTMSYKKFVSEVLKKFNPTSIFCGPDFKYGYNAEGDVTYLKTQFENVYVLGYVKDHFGNKISSSAIKKCLLDGDIDEANRYLGRPYALGGVVAHGFSEGAKIGFPTANLSADTSYVLPPNGVYFTRTEVDGIQYNSITNIGIHPTINKVTTPTIETHIIDEKFDSLYGYHLKIYFYKKVRAEKKFDNLEALREQISHDILEAKEYFAYRVKK